MYGEMSWEAGRTQCQSDGAEMVVPESVEENQFIAQLLPDEDCCFYIN